MKRCSLAFGFATLAAGLSAAVPVIRDGSVTMAQRSGHGKVIVEYALDDASAIVTMDVQTNAGDNAWVSIGAAAFATSISGDVGHAVSAGEGKRIVWDVRNAWPGHKIQEGGIRAVLTAWATNSPPDWLAVDLASEDVHWFCASEDMLPCGDLSGEAAKTRWLVLKRVKASGVRWVMGASSADPQYEENQKSRFVTLTNDYYMGVYEFTQGQFMTVGCTWSANPKYPTLIERPLLPVLGVTWNNIRGKSDWPGPGYSRAQAHDVTTGSYMGKLRNRTGIDFDLPTEAQWEFACRAGTDAPLYNGHQVSLAALDKIAWVWGNTPEEVITVVKDGKTTYEEEHIPQPVGGKVPNAWGFYDMLGNASEFCLDHYSAAWTPPFDDYEPEGAIPDTTATRIPRLRRGGSSAEGESVTCHCAYRMSTNQGASYHQNGFRVVCPVTLKW